MGETIYTYTVYGVYAHASSDGPQNDIVDDQHARVRGEGAQQGRGVALVERAHPALSVYLLSGGEHGAHFLLAHDVALAAGLDHIQGVVCPPHAHAGQPPDHEATGETRGLARRR